MSLNYGLPVSYRSAAACEEKKTIGLGRDGSSVVQKSDVPRLFRRLQLAEHQISGRVGMLAMADLRDIQRSSVGVWRLDETAIAAFENLRWRLKQSVPRILRVRDGEKPVLVFTDGACELSDDGSFMELLLLALFVPLLVVLNVLVGELMVV